MCRLSLSPSHAHETYNCMCPMRLPLFGIRLASSKATILRKLELKKVISYINAAVSFLVCLVSLIFLFVLSFWFFSSIERCAHCSRFHHMCECSFLIQWLCLCLCHMSSMKYSNDALTTLNAPKRIFDEILSSMQQLAQFFLLLSLKLVTQHSMFSCC